MRKTLKRTNRHYSEKFKQQAKEMGTTEAARKEIKRLKKRAWHVFQDKYSDPSSPQINPHK